MQAIPPTLGTARTVQLAAGVELAPDALAERLSQLGYTRVDVVEHRGEFAGLAGAGDPERHQNNEPGVRQLVRAEREALHRGYHVHRRVVEVEDGSLRIEVSAALREKSLHVLLERE